MILTRSLSVGRLRRNGEVGIIMTFNASEVSNRVSCVYLVPYKSTIRYYRENIPDTTYKHLLNFYALGLYSAACGFITTDFAVSLSLRFFSLSLSLSPLSFFGDFY